MACYFLTNRESVVQVRQRCRALAEALGAADCDAVEQVAGELAANSVEHRSRALPALLRIGCRRSRLVVETWNRSAGRPSWRTRKGDGEGGYGLLLVEVLASEFRRAWWRWAGIGIVHARAEFALSPSAGLARQQRANLAFRQHRS